MRGPVTRSSGLPGALVGLVAASALICGLLFCDTDVSRAVSTVGADWGSRVAALQMIMFTKLGGDPIVSPEAADTQEITSEFWMVNYVVQRNLVVSSFTIFQVSDHRSYSV